MSSDVLTVLLAPGRGAQDVLDVLADLSGAALVDEFLWVRGDAAPGSAWRVSAGRRVPTTLEDVVVGRRPDRVRLCVLVPLVTGDGPLSSAAEQDVAATLGANAAGAPVTRLRVLLARGGQRRPRAEEVAREGWHTVLVAPENTAGPGQGRWLLPAHLGADEAARLLAPQVAGTLGLWVGATGCVFDELPVAPGPSVRVVRAFYRHVDAAAVEQALRDRVLDIRPVTPLPRQSHGAPTAHLADPGAGGAEMAARLWARHAPLLTGVRHHVPDRPVPPVGLGTALAWFPTYARRAVRGRPDQWYAALRTRLIDEVPHTRSAQALAAIATPQYRVLVDGYRPDGQPVGWRDVGEVVDHVEAVLPPDPTAPPLPDDLSSLWQDFASGALTLVDAGDRGGQAMPPARSGPARGVVRAIAEAVPGPEHDLVLGQGNVAALTGVGRVAAGDVLGTDLLRRRLVELGDRHGLGPAVGPSLEQLGEWHARHRGTYAHAVAAGLAHRLETVRAELRDDVTALAEAGSPSEIDPEQRERMVLIARVVTGIAVLAVVVVLGALLLGLLLEPSVAVAVVAAGALAVGVASTAGVYAVAHRSLFRALDRRRTLVARVEADQQNLRQALRDYRRLHDAYRDLLLWSRAVGVVLADPFGRGGDDDRPRRPVLRDLPRSARVGRAEVDPDAVDAAAATLRTELYVTGWLDAAWRTALADARGDLAEWVDELERRGPTRRTGDAVWAGVLEGPAGHRAPVAARLLAAIADDADPPPAPGAAPGRGPVTLTRFLAGVDGSEVGDGGDRFDPAHFDDEARTRDRARVAGTAASGSRVGLSRTDVLVQYGDAVPAWELEIGAADPEPDDHEHGTDPGHADDALRF